MVTLIWYMAQLWACVFGARHAICPQGYQLDGVHPNGVFMCAERTQAPPGQTYDDSPFATELVGHVWCKPHETPVVIQDFRHVACQSEYARQPAW